MQCAEAGRKDDLENVCCNGRRPKIPDPFPRTNGYLYHGVVERQPSEQWLKETHKDAQSATFLAEMTVHQAESNAEASGPRKL